jgi:hypothetical protein
VSGASGPAVWPSLFLTAGWRLEGVERLGSSPIRRYIRAASQSEPKNKTEPMLRLVGVWELDFAKGLTR